MLLKFAVDASENQAYNLLDLFRGAVITRLLSTAIGVLLSAVRWILRWNDVVVTAGRILGFRVILCLPRAHSQRVQSLEVAMAAS
jgi:hypothetical protein